MYGGGKFARILGFIGLLLATPVAFAQPAVGGGCTPAAHTFCVTSTGDNVGTDPAAGAGTGTLRQALVDSNAAGGANTIGFDIPGTGPQTITLASNLTTINSDPYATTGLVSSLLVDGYSQPGSALNTNTPDDGGLNTKLMIEIVGSVYGFNYGCCTHPYLTVTLQGLATHGFYDGTLSGQGSGLTPKAKWNLYGNFIGTGVDGAALPVKANGSGIGLQYDDAQIGGTQAWQRNLISGNTYTAVSGGSPGDSIVVEGNLIGTDITGTKPIPNGYGVEPAANSAGIRVGCTGAGCTAAGHPSRNVISGNSLGMDISGSGTGGLQVKGNYIGTDWSGTQPLPNGPCDIYVCGGIWVQLSGAPTAIIGGFGAGEGNVIAYNNGPGILSPDARVEESFDNQGNAIHNNSIADIAFSFAGRIANDAGDTDAGSNNQQNHPVIQSASVSGIPGSLTLNVTYLVDSIPDTSCAQAGCSKYPLRIDFYVDIDEGSGAYLVADSYPANSAQVARTISLPLPISVQVLNGFVASATDANGYSSEFSHSWVFDRIFANAFEVP